MYHNRGRNQEPVQSELVPTDQFHRNCKSQALPIIVNDSLIYLPAQRHFASQYIFVTLSEDSDLQPQGSIMEKKKRSILPCVISVINLDVRGRWCKYCRFLIRRKTAFFFLEIESQVVPTSSETVLLTLKDAHLNN